MVRPADFVILCHPRSGSNLLSWALLHHDDVAMAGEIFHEAHDEAAAGLPEGVAPFRRGMNGRDFLTRGIFPPRRGPARCARGFKLFYEHARGDALARTAWQYLLRERRIRVIHLIRRNLFDCQVSLGIALRSGEWYRLADTPGTPLAVAPFAISPWACQEYFSRITTWRMWAADAFARHPLLTIDYDEFCADFAGTMAHVFDFIGVAAMPVEPALVRQARHAPEQQIINYDELRRWFRHSLFESFFADGHATT